MTSILTLGSKIPASEIEGLEEIENAVHKTGDETISGFKTFNNNIILNTTGRDEDSARIILKDLDYNFVEGANLPTENKLRSLYILNSDGKIRGQFRNIVFADSSKCSTQIGARLQKNDGSYIEALAEVIVNGDGTTGFYFPKCTTKPTTSSSASNTKVAVVVENYINGSSWYRKWSDGFIEQGSRINLSDAYNVHIDFLTNFSSNSSYILLGHLHAQNATANLGVISYGYTGFNVDNATGGNFHWYAAGY